MADKQTLQFDFDVAAARRLDELVELTGSVSRAEVVRRALSLFDKALTLQREGGKVVIKTTDGSEDVLHIM